MIRSPRPFHRALVIVIGIAFMSSLSHAAEFDLERIYGFKAGVNMYDTHGGDLCEEGWEGSIPGGSPDYGPAGGIFMRVPLSSGDSLSGRFFLQPELLFSCKTAKYIDIPVLLNARLTTSKLFAQESYNSVYAYIGPVIGVCLEGDAAEYNINPFDVGIAVGIEGNHLRSAWNGRLILDLRITFGLLSTYEATVSHKCSKWPDDYPASEKNLAGSFMVGWGF